MESGKPKRTAIGYFEKESRHSAEGWRGIEAVDGDVAWASCPNFVDFSQGTEMEQLRADQYR
jgi:hypothetical protein